MKITNLLENPKVKNQCIELIEQSFGYDKVNSFATDFYPLINEENHKNCYVILEGSKVIAHIGLLKRTIKIDNKNFTFNFYGGIAVDENTRGKGVFKRLFNYVLEKNSHCHLHLLWSDKTKMYEKFHFYPAITQYEYSHNGLSNGEFTKLSYEQLTTKDQERIQELYANDTKIKVTRSLDDWKRIQKITSADFYIKKHNQVIVDYFVMNKGADLKGVIHEHYQLDEKKLNELRSHGKVWTAQPYGKDINNLLFSSLVRPGLHFKKLISDYTKNQINITTFDFDGVDFCFQDKEYYLPMDDFITGIFGPGQFEDLKDLKPIFICGLDSI